MGAGLPAVASLSEAVGNTTLEAVIDVKISYSNTICVDCSSTAMLSTHWGPYQIGTATIILSCNSSV